jgi:hypothetical protein
MQDRPTAPELLDALRAFMRDRAEHARDRWERFQFQVAANSLAIIQREWEMDDLLMRDEWARLDELLGAEDVPAGQHAFHAALHRRNGELSERIRAGEFDGENEDALLGHLWESVIDKVRVASPNEVPAQPMT